MIPFNQELFSVAPSNLNITDVIMIGPRGIRVFLENQGSFSLYWDSIDKHGVNGYFSGLVVQDKFNPINNEIPTDLIRPTKNGYVQVILYPKSRNTFDVYIRVFNYFNHRLTKNFKEFRVDRVASCSTLDTKTVDDSRSLDDSLI